jgi:hypothetical protein
MSALFRIKSMVDIRQRGNRRLVSVVSPGMDPGAECRKLVAALREKAKAAPDAELKAEYQYLVRGFLRLAHQFERDMNTQQFEAKQLDGRKSPGPRSRKAAV